ncbi:MAG: dTDP-glucose 4,6-dehydratase [Alphaproteobacteria bacterium]|nr:dTDP-glucose 4,6-dehydratase [Alphaproteobacteria bacterium]
MRRILITGGAGFIGSHVTERMCVSFPSAEVTVLDKMTYAADVNHILPLIASDRIRLVVGDICDFNLCRSLTEDCDLVIHAAAESHVDRSFHSSILFTQTNTLGTHTVMEACLTSKVARVIHISTDEVYGEVLEGSCDESSGLNPTNPYSASKAAAEMIVNGYRHSFQLPTIIVRANNIFGIRQFPEKLIPRCIVSLIFGEKIPLHGNGMNVRHYLAATDFAGALALLAERGEVNGVYNIGSPDEFTNRDVVRMVCNEFDVSFDSCAQFVNDRPFNDRRYAVSWDKIGELGWMPQHSLPEELPNIVAWYKENAAHIRRRMMG